MNYKLIYINKVGYDYKGMGTYEFIFCDDTIDLADVFGNGWESFPAEGSAQPPWEDCISKVGTIKCKDNNLEVVQDSQFFAVADAKDNIICLGYELIDETFSLGTRLVFHFGEDASSVENKLGLRKLKLKYEDE